MADSPLLPLITASAALLGLVLLLGFGVMKLRKAGRDTSAPAGDRLSEEAFAAATIKAALASGPTARPASVGAAGAPADGDTVDAAVLEALPVGLIVTDEAGVVRRCTGPARDWLGIAGPGTGYPYRTALAAWPAIADGLARVHAGDAPPPFTVLTDAASAPSPRLTVAITRWIPRGARGGAVAVLSTAIVGVPVDVEPAAAPAEPAPDAGAEASRLASGLAHELANSLTTIHGYAHLVDRSALNDADRSALEHIAGSSEKMLATVEAFRALVRPLPITAIAFPPVEAVRAAITLARQEAERPDAVVQVASTPSGMVHGDQVLLEEALAAVIRNAIEASALMSPAPPVEVSVAQVPGTSRVSIVVTDHGPGVPADIRGRIFQPFATDKPGHLGLGLARAAQVVRAHPGGTIALEHPAGGGLVVAMGLPQHG